MKNAVTKPEPQKQLKRPSPIRRYLGIAGLALTVLGGCFLAGWLMGRSEVTTLRSQLDADRRAAQSNQDKCSQQLATEQRIMGMLEARRNLDQAISALDARNFGIAEQQAKKALRWLVAAHAEGSAAEVVKSLDAFHFVATEDLGPQRKQLVDWVGQIDPQIVVPVP